MSDDSKISPPEVGDEPVAGTYKESAPAPVDVRAPLEARITAAIAGPLGHQAENYRRPHQPLVTEPFCELDDEAYPCTPLAAAVGEVMAIVDNLAAELRATVGAALESRSDVRRELAAARADADRANRLLSRLYAEREHQDPDIRARIKAALEAVPATGALSVADFLDPATDAVGAVVFPVMKAFAVMVEDRDKQLAAVREELVKANDPRSWCVFWRPGNGPTQQWDHDEFGVFRGGEGVVEIVRLPKETS